MQYIANNAQKARKPRFAGGKQKGAKIMQTFTHSTEKEPESETIWRRFVVTGTLEEIRELAEMLRDKKLCHEEIAMILTMMRFREEE